MSIISPDKSGQINPPTYSLLKEISIDIPIVQVDMFPDYQFNPDLYKLDKYVLVDIAENGANDWNQKETLLWGG